jgi:hypothetical protein
MKGQLLNRGILQIEFEQLLSRPEILVYRLDLQKSP